VRWKGKLKLGWFPLPLAEVERIRKFLVFPAASFAAVDPCIGEGGAFAAITAEATGCRYGIELDAYRAEQARLVTDETIQGNCFDVQCAVESFSLVYLNPPYDHEISETACRRTEPLFLEHCYRWLKPAGVLVLVIPGDRLAQCGNVLAGEFRDVQVYRLTEAENVRYKQVVLFGVRRTNREQGASGARAGAVTGLATSAERDSNTRAWQEVRANCRLFLPRPTASTYCRKRARSAWSTAACPSTRSKTCWRNQRRTVRRDASSSPSLHRYAVAR
jgi:hypothetical protein